MPGKLRADGVLAPVYGPGSKLFTLEVHHDGFFCGLGKNRKYLNEKISVFDYVDADSWSYAEIEYILMRLGYWGEQKLKVYWLLPGKNMSDGLRTVMSDEETIVMSQIVHKVKNIVIYLDHHDHVAGNIRDDIVPNIWPCSDMSAWEKTNGPEVKPPVYEKKVGRPPKSRRKAPHEVQGKYGPKLSKHGIEMHCRNCKGSGHNIAGCKLKKAELNLEQQVPNEPMPTFESEPYQGLDEGVITQEYHEIGAGSSQLFSQLDNTIVSQMMDMPTQCLREQQSAGPLPDCDYITNNQPTVRPMPLTTATKAGRLKRKTIDPKSGEEGTKKKPGRARQ